jgi:hypothetical protein
MFKNLNWLLLPLLFVLPKIANAHSFGTVYTLPIPAYLYVYTGGAVILFSFLIISFFLKENNNTNLSVEKEIKFNFLSRVFTGKNTKIISTLSLGVFVLAILSGYLGENVSAKNFNMNYFWIFFVLGITYLSSIIGNIYELINPWKIIASKIPDKFKGGVVYYPEWIGYFPALIFYFVFIWLELFGKLTPFSLSKILLDYTVINIVGIYIIGSINWFKYCEFFSILFRLVSDTSFLQVKDEKLFWRIPFSGLLETNITRFSLLLFSIFILSSTAYDGLKETDILMVNYIIYFEDFFSNLVGVNALQIFHTFNLGLLLAVFTTLYLLFIYLSIKIINSKQKILDVAFKFAPSLIPIALVYNIAHYFTLILTEGPKMLSQISDPFGVGLNLFGTANWKINYVPDTFYVWHIQVGLIVIGHIVAVLISHIIAVKVFETRKKAIISQLPMLVLMIFYTMFGLWILSLPISG